MEHSYTEKFPLLHEEFKNKDRSLTCTLQLEKASKPEGSTARTLSSLQDPTGTELQGAEKADYFPSTTGPEDQPTSRAHCLQTQTVSGVDLPVPESIIVVPHVYTQNSSSVVVDDMNFEKASEFAVPCLNKQNVEEVALPYLNKENVADRTAQHPNKQDCSDFPVPYLNNQNVVVPYVNKTPVVDASMPYPGTQKKTGGNSTEKQPSAEDFQASLEMFFVELGMQHKDLRASALGKQIMQVNRSVVLFLPSDLHVFTTLLAETTRFCDDYIARVTDTITQAQNLLQAEMLGKSQTQQKLLLRELDKLLHAGCGNLESARRMKKWVEQLNTDFKIDCDDKVCEILVPEDTKEQEPETFCKDLLKCVALGLIFSLIVSFL